MKVFQIGFNKCGSKYVHTICKEQGYATIYSDCGMLARRMMGNFLNGNPLLTGYEQYEFFGGMENVSMNLYPHMLFYKLLDEQYPGSKFILNTRHVETWIVKRMEEPGYLTDYLWSSGHSSSAVAILKWRELWKKLHDEATSYFADREMKDFLVFDVEKDDPRTLYLFLNRGKKEAFMKIYNRLHTRMTTREVSGVSGRHSKFPVYCITLPFRKDTVECTLQDYGFHRVCYVQAIVPDDVSKEEVSQLSTTFLPSPPTHVCKICSHNAWHPGIFQKPTKCCVHLSYLMCLYHAMEHSSESHVIVFEDDIFFKGDRRDMDDTIQEFLDTDMDVLYLGFGHCKGCQDRAPSGGCLRIIELPRNQSIICKHAIVYKMAYVRRVFWKLLPLMDCSDVHFNHVNICEGARVCIPTTPFVFQDRVKYGSHNANGQELDIPLF